VAEPFAINFTVGAEDDVRSFSRYARRIILDGVELHLRHHPAVGTRRIKRLRSNPIAGWELRLGDYRVLYDVDEPNRIVTIHVVGEKRGNRLLVQGKEYMRHESNRPERGENEP
jgi:mRNA-degrading endonuclease RelE of RelBE toxin-antitoxin system